MKVNLGQPVVRQVVLVGAAATSLVGFVYLVVTDASAGSATCNGESATMVGDGGDNEIGGTSGRDVIQARGGNDEVDGHGGNDTRSAAAQGRMIWPETRGMTRSSDDPETTASTVTQARIALSVPPVSTTSTAVPGTTAVRASTSRNAEAGRLPRRRVIWYLL